MFVGNKNAVLPILSGVLLVVITGIIIVTVLLWRQHQRNAKARSLPTHRHGLMKCMLSRMFLDKCNAFLVLYAVYMVDRTGTLIAKLEITVRHHYAR